MPDAIQPSGESSPRTRPASAMHRQRLENSWKNLCPEMVAGSRNIVTLPLMNGLAQGMRRRNKLAGYIRSEVLGVSMMTLAVLMAISVALFLAEMLGDLADGKLLLSTLAELLLLRLPEAVLLTAPLALVVGLLMSLGELAQGEEFSVMRSAGLAPGRLLRVVLALAAMWAAGLLLVSGWVAPWAEQRSARIAERMADDLLLASIRPGQFQTLGGGRLTVYVRAADLEVGRLEGIFVHFTNDDQVELIAAESGQLFQRSETGERVLSLSDGVHLGQGTDSGGLPMRRIAFERNDIQLPLAGHEFQEDPSRWQFLPALLADSSSAAGLELQRRLMPPIICAVLALFVLPITLSGARGRRFGTVLAAVAVYLVYSNIANLVLVRADPGSGAWPGIWPLHAAALLLAIVPLASWWRRW